MGQGARVTLCDTGDLVDGSSGPDMTRIKACVVQSTSSTISVIGHQQPLDQTVPSLHSLEVEHVQ